MIILRELAMYRKMAIQELSHLIYPRMIHLITILAYHEIRKEDWDRWVEEISSLPRFNIIIKAPSRWLKYSDLKYAMWDSYKDTYLHHLGVTVQRIIKKYKIPFTYNKNNLIKYLNEYNYWLIDRLDKEGKTEDGIPYETIDNKLKELVVKYKDTISVKGIYV